MRELIKETNTVKDNMGNTYIINVIAPPKTQEVIKEYNKRISEAINLGINNNK